MNRIKWNSYVARKPMTIHDWLRGRWIQEYSAPCPLSMTIKKGKLVRSKVCAYKVLDSFFIDEQLWLYIEFGRSFPIPEMRREMRMAFDADIAEIWYFDRAEHV